MQPLQSYSMPVIFKHNWARRWVLAMLGKVHRVAELSQQRSITSLGSVAGCTRLYCNCWAQALQHAFRTQAACPCCILEAAAPSVLSWCYDAGGGVQLHHGQHVLQEGHPADGGDPSWGALNFELSMPTPRTFLRSFIQASAADWPPLSIWRYGLVPRLHPNADRDCPGCHTTSGISCAVSSAVSAQPSGPDM